MTFQAFDVFGYPIGPTHQDRAAAERWAANYIAGAGDRRVYIGNGEERVSVVRRYSVGGRPDVVKVLPLDQPGAPEPVTVDVDQWTD